MLFESYFVGRMKKTDAAKILRIPFFMRPFVTPNVSHFCTFVKKHVSEISFEHIDAETDVSMSAVSFPEPLAISLRVMVRQTIDIDHFVVMIDLRGRMATFNALPDKSKADTVEKVTELLLSAKRTFQNECQRLIGLFSDQLSIGFERTKNEIRLVLPDLEAALQLCREKPPNPWLSPPNLRCAPHLTAKLHDMRPFSIPCYYSLGFAGWEEFHFWIWVILNQIPPVWNTSFYCSTYEMNHLEYEYFVRKLVECSDAHDHEIEAILPSGMRKSALPA